MSDGDGTAARIKPDISLTLVAVTAVAAASALVLGTVGARVFRGDAAFDAQPSIPLLLAAICAFALLSLGVGMVVARLHAPAPLPGAARWRAFKARRQGDRTDAEFGRAVATLAFCCGAIALVLVLILAPFQAFLALVFLIAGLVAADHVVTICRDASWTWRRSLVSAMLRGTFVGFVVGYFIG